MVLNVLGYRVPEIEAVFNKCRWCCGTLRRSKSDAVNIVVAFNLNPRNAKIHVPASGNLIEVESREVDAKFIQQSGRESAYERKRLYLVERLDAKVALRTVAAGVVGGYVVHRGEERAVREQVRSQGVIESPVVLVTPVRAGFYERHVLYVRNPVKASAEGIDQGHVLALRPAGRTYIQSSRNLLTLRRWKTRQHACRRQHARDPRLDSGRTQDRGSDTPGTVLHGQLPELRRFHPRWAGHIMSSASQPFVGEEEEQLVF